MMVILVTAAGSGREILRLNDQNRPETLQRELHQRASGYPDKPGVYLMKNALKRIIYIGKAKSIKKRVRSYFTVRKDLKTMLLMENVTDIETIITRNEHEALLLENNLIKQWNPRFNINLKDGKSYPVIRITNEDFPRIFRTRRIIFDGSLYFGPFPHAAQLDLYLDLIEKLFPLRKCRGRLKKRHHPCLYFHIGRCSAPCCGKISREEYRILVDKIEKLLSGRTDRLVKELTNRREESSRNLDFEEAAVLRDQIKAILEFKDCQQVVDNNTEARDYLGLASEDNLCSFVILKMRNGALTDKELFRTEIYSDIAEATIQFIVQYYSKIHNPPSALYVQDCDPGPLTACLPELIGKQIAVINRGSGNYKKMLDMAAENAQEDLIARKRENKLKEDLVLLQKALGLNSSPKRIEGFDIAHLSGKDTVAAMVSFLNGKPEKKSYRHFKLRTLNDRIDDYEAMREIIARRYTRLMNEALEKPDLILVDGGIGQVNAAGSVLRSLGLADIPLVGLAKQKEEIFRPGINKPTMLEKDSPALRILQAVRDESHRFATGFHKRLRAKRTGRSVLEEVKGIGKQRSRRLITSFGSLRAILKSSPEDLAKRGGLTVDTALALVDYLKEYFKNQMKKSKE